MRRDSKRAERLARATAASPRQLEEWSQSKGGIAFLAPVESSDDEALVAALLAVGTERRDRVSTALNVASRFGLACDGHKIALRRRLQLDDPEIDELTAPLEVDEAGETTDVGAIEAERRAAVVEKRLADDDLAAALNRNLAGSSTSYGETSEQLWRSWTTALVTMMSGAGPYYTPAFPAILRLDAAEVDHLGKDGGLVGGPLGSAMTISFDSLGTGFSLGRLRQVIEEVPAADLARPAPRLQPTIEFLAALARTPYDLAQDESAACYVPFLLAIGGIEAVDRFASLPKVIAAGITKEK
jgi:hypothetical protein